MPTREDVVLMAAYNADMNQKLYAAAATLPADEVSADRKAFFGSILGTLNHLVAGDTIWLKRFSTHPAAWPALEPLRGLPPPSGLTHTFADNLPELARIRIERDATITAWAAQVRDEDLAQPFDYANMKGDRFHKHFGSVVAHFFNHQTHHRGQVTTLLSQQGIDVGVTDLLAWVPNLS